jgi:hypothetical protein
MDHGFIKFALIPFLVAIYFVPSLIARARMHPHLGSIFTLNILTGWLLITWIGTFVWACWKVKLGPE